MSAAAISAITAANSASLAANGMRGGAADPTVLGALLAYVLVFMLAGALLGSRKPGIGALEGGIIGSLLAIGLAFASGAALAIAEALLS